MRAGKITIIAGCMFASKTETLVSILNKEKYKKRYVACYKPARDTRYSISEVVSHNGNKMPCIPVRDSNELTTEIRKLSEEFSALSIGIDEVQFFDEDVVHLAWNLSFDGHHIIAAGLNLDSFGKPFGPMAQLLAIADDVIKLHAQCKICGENATLTYRHPGTSSDTVLVGGADMYEPRCRVHWKD